MSSVKSVLAVEVDDSAFKRFRDLFSAYSDEVDKMPEAWQKLNAVIADSAKGLESGAINAKDAFAAIAAQAGIVGAALRDAIKAQNKLGQASNRSQKSMNALRKSAEGVGVALKNVGGWIVRIGAFAGVGGLLSGIGFGDLAGATFARSRASGRLGISPGALASWDVNAQQFLGREALEGAVAAQGDVTKGGALAGLGINPRAANAMSPAELAFATASKALAIYQSEKNSGMYLNDPRLLAYQSELGGDIADLRNLDQNGGQRALDAARGNYGRDIAALEIPAKEREEWNKLKITLDRAGVTIQTVFIDKLSELAPDIGNLTTRFVSLFGAIANTKTVDNAIHALHYGLDALNKFLEPKNLEAAHKEFDTMIGTVKAFGAELKVLVDKFRWLLPKEQTPDEKKMWALDAKEKAQRWDALRHWASSGVDFVARAGGSALNSLGVGKADIVNKIAGIARKMGVNPILALATAQHESGLNPYAIGDKGTSFGLFQLHQGGELGNLTQKQAFDVGINTKTALTEVAAVQKLSKQAALQRFSRAVRYAMTHHAGPTVSHNDIMALFDTPGLIAATAQRPADPYDYALDVNRKFLDLKNSSRQAPKVAPKAVHHAPNNVKLIVYNSTAARVSVSANAVGLG